MRKPAGISSRLLRQAGQLGLAAVAALTMSLAAAPGAQAASLIGPGAKVEPISAGSKLVTEARFDGGRGGHGGGGFHGGGFHGGGFRGGGGFHGGGPAFHGGGGGFRGGAPAFRGGAVHAAPVFRGGGVRAFPGGSIYRGGGLRYAAPLIARHSYVPVRQHWRPRHHFGPRYYGHYGPRYVGYAPAYYGPRRFCRIVWTYYGPRKICRYKPWRHHWRHHHRRHHWRVYW